MGFFKLLDIPYSSHVDAIKLNITTCEMLHYLANGKHSVSKYQLFNENIH